MDFSEEQRSPSERTLDELVAQELCTCGPAASLVWDAVGWPMPSEVDVQPQVKRGGDGRTTDVEARANGLRLLCEDKLADGVFRSGQIDGYRDEIGLDPAHVRAVVIAPAKFFLRRKLPERIGVVTVEALADHLEAAAEKLASDSGPAANELARGYRYRARTYRYLCQSKEPVLSQPHLAFREGYDKRAQEIADGRVRLQEGTLSQGGGFAWFAEDHPAPSSFELAHKIYDGVLDLRLPGWTLSELRTHIEQMRPDEAPPAGWCVSTTKNARKSKLTGETTPVLRYEVERVKKRIEVCDEVEARGLGRDAADSAVLPADAVGCWLRNGGADRLARGPTLDTLRAELVAAIKTATRLGRSDVASGLTRLSADVNRTAPLARAGELDRIVAKESQER